MMNQTVKELAKRRLTLNGVDFKEEQLDYLVDEVVQRVLNFCNLEELPIELHCTVAKIVGELVQPSNAEGGNAKTIKVGDTSVEFGTNFTTTQIDALMNNYQSELYEFRKVRW